MTLKTLRRLERVVPAADGRPTFDGASSPIRNVTHQIAFDRDGWTKERADRVAGMFNAMASDWNARHDVHHPEPLVDALDRGGPFNTAGCVCEVGSGTGLLTAILASRFAAVVAVEIAESMARLAPSDAGYRVLADGASLPGADASYDVVVLFNAFLFPTEIERVLTPGGALIWVSGMGDDTPIHLSVDDVGAALPGEWVAVAADAGWGNWAVFRRG